MATWPAAALVVRICCKGPDPAGALSLSRQEYPGVGRERSDDAGGWVRCGIGSAVSGRVLPGSGARSGPATVAKKEDAGRGRARVCGIGAAWAVLHIRPGPAGGGSAESCGNASALNAVEVLPCAEGSALHMGARPLKTDVLVRAPESQGKARTGPRGRRPPMCSTPARAGRSFSAEAPLPSDEAAFPQSAREDPGPPGGGPPPVRTRRPRASTPRRARPSGRSAPDGYRRPAPGAPVRRRSPSGS